MNSENKHGKDNSLLLMKPAEEAAMEWINEEVRVPWPEVERTHEALTVMQYMRACRDVCNHAIGHSPLSDLVKDEKEKAKYKDISYAYCEECVYLFRIPSGAIVLCKGPDPLNAWKNFMENKVR